jgi:mannose-6-phosphate isomerase-like protein (cupin superfamily)
MPLVRFDSVAEALPAAWRSTIVARVGPAQVKVLRMDEMPYEEETHEYNEGLLVVTGQLLLEVAGEDVVVEAGQMFLAEAGVPHSVRRGSRGTLVIIDV